jgi:hypothetical protein
VIEEEIALENLKIQGDTNPSPQKDLSFAEWLLKRVKVQTRT